MSERFRQSFINQEGPHNFELSNGAVVTGLSADSWEDFTHMFDDLQYSPQPVGNIILTPELITIAPFSITDPLGELAVNADRRIGEACDLSTAYPNSTLILGTPITDQAGQPRNALLYIQNGAVAGDTMQMPYLLPGMVSPFGRATSARESKPLPDMPNILPMISSDLLFHRKPQSAKTAFLANGGASEAYENPITGRTDTLLVSSCWQIPRVAAMPEMRAAHEFIIPMQTAANMLLHRYGALRDIVVLDRLPARTLMDSDPIMPLNAHFWLGRGE